MHFRSEIDIRPEEWTRFIQVGGIWMMGGGWPLETSIRELVSGGYAERERRILGLASGESAGVLLP